MKVAFNGRKLGDIGITYPIEVILTTGLTIKQTIDGIHEGYEHVSKLRLINDQDRPMAVCFLPNGNRYDGKLPKGEYQYCGECFLNIKTETKAAMILGPDNTTWYLVNGVLNNVG